MGISYFNDTIGGEYLRHIEWIGDDDDDDDDLELCG